MAGCKKPVQSVPTVLYIFSMITKEEQIYYMRAFPMCAVDSIVAFNDLDAYK